MMDKNDKPVVNFAALQSVEDYVEKSGKFRTNCASFQIPGRDSGSATALYLPYCEKQRFDFGHPLNEYRGQGVFTPPETGKPVQFTDFILFREHFHDIHCPDSCSGYRNKRVASLLKKFRPHALPTGKWTGKEIVTAIIVPVIVCVVGSLLAWLTPEGRRLLHLDKPQPDQQISSLSVPPTVPTTAGRSSHHSDSNSSISLDDNNSQYELFHLSPKEKAQLDKAKASLFKYKAALLDTPAYYQAKVARDAFRKDVEDAESQYGCLIDLDKIQCMPKPPAAITNNEVGIDIPTKMVADEFSKTFVWMIRNKSSKVRVPIVMFVSLMNNRSTPVKIDLLYLDAKTVNGWADIRMVDSFFPVEQAMSEKPIVFQGKNGCASLKGEYLLPKLYDRIIQSGDKVEGWIIAEYPRGFKYGNSIGDMRISLLAGDRWIASKTFPANPRVYRNQSFDWYFIPLDTLITEDW